MSTVQRVIERAIKNIDENTQNAFHVPGEIYNSEEVFQLERDNIFMKEWLCVGRVEEIPNAGDYIASRVLGEPFLVARNDKGEIHAFSNLCRHRGVEVASGRGNTSEFSCPYHAWLYDLDGKLVGAPYIKERKAELTDCALPAIRLETWKGWMFINFDTAATPLADDIEEFAGEFAFLDHESCQLANCHVIDLDCNWKFVVENLMDFYHVGTLHARTFGGRLKSEEFPVKLLKKGGFSVFFKAAPLQPDGQRLFPKMPALDGHGDDFACIGHMTPNINFSARADNLRFWVTWPITPSKSKLLSYTLFPKEDFADPEFSNKVDQYINYLDVIIDEDRGMVESLQNASASGRFAPGPMSNLEQTIHHVIRNYLDQLSGDRQ